MLIPNIFPNLGGYLSGKGRVSLLNVDCTLEGEFVNGKLHGPVRGLTTKGTYQNDQARYNVHTISSRL